MAAIVEDVERDLSRRRGINAHVPIAGDREDGNGIAVTVERAARKRAMGKSVRAWPATNSLEVTRIESAATM